MTFIVYLAFGTDAIPDGIVTRVVTANLSTFCLLVFSRFSNSKWPTMTIRLQLQPATFSSAECSFGRTPGRPSAIIIYYYIVPAIIGARSIRDVRFDCFFSPLFLRVTGSSGQSLFRTTPCCLSPYFPFYISTAISCMRAKYNT